MEKDCYDYGARFYDQVLGRFHTIDPFTEKFYYLSPYQYGSNNPVTNIDIDGPEGVPFWNTWLIMKWVEFKTGSREWGGTVSRLLTGQSGNIPSNINVSAQTRKINNMLGTISDVTTVSNGIKNVGEGTVNIISSFPGVETVGDLACVFYYGVQGDFENVTFRAVALVIPAVSGSVIRTVGKFASESKLLTHFEKDAGEFGDAFKTVSDYEKGAQNFFRNINEDLVQFTRKNGDVVQYNVKTNEFGVVDKNGNIRTYFKPEKGQEYFMYQLKKENELNIK